MLYLSVRPQTEAAAAEYASFRRGLDRDAERLHQHDLVAEPLPGDVFDRYAGFVVGGSPFNLTDPADRKSDTQHRIERDLERLAAEALAERTTALFTCYGIGIVTQLLGGTVDHDHGEEAAAVHVRATPAAAADPIAGGLPADFRALTAHKEGSGAAPADAVLLATNDGCPAQMYRAGTRLYATQFHPEPTPRDFTWRMAVYRDAGYFDPADYERLAATIEQADVHAPESILRRFSNLVG